MTHVPANHELCHQEDVWSPQRPSASQSVRYTSCIASFPGDEAGDAVRRSGMTRYGFSIKTRTGQRVENISIVAASLADAERRLRQMYLQCEILAYREQVVRPRIEAAQPRIAAAQLGRVIEFSVVRTPRLKTGTH
jgi:hypothetical protein